MIISLVEQKNSKRLTEKEKNNNHIDNDVKLFFARREEVSGKEEKRKKIEERKREFNRSLISSPRAPTLNAQSSSPFLGRRSETSPSWLEAGCEAGKYRGATGGRLRDCGAPSAFEPEGIAARAALGWFFVSSRMSDTYYGILKIAAQSNRSEKEN
jgi:hypothetical protein